MRATRRVALRASSRCRACYDSGVPPLLDLRNLTVTFAGKAAVDDVSFTIAPGETLGLVGESGSGKSVSSLAIMRLLPPNAAVSGEIVFDQQPLLRLSDEQMRA